MHWNIEQILWALVLSAHLVLLIVLLGRDRASRFPWFTASIVVATVRLIADHLLNSKLTSVAFHWQSYTTTVLSLILTFGVLFEVARSMFSSGKAGLILKLKGWLGWSFLTFGLAGFGLWGWARLEGWQILDANFAHEHLALAGFIGAIGLIFVDLLTVEVGILVAVFGGRFGFGWKTHARQIALGLSTNAIGFLTIARMQDSIATAFNASLRDPSRHITKADADRASHLYANLGHTIPTIIFVVAVWWIFWLWRDEPGSGSAGVASAQVPVLAGPPMQAEIPEGDQEGDPDFRD